MGRNSKIIIQLKTFIFFLLSGIMLQACSKNNGASDACSGVAATFTNVQPIINSTCATSASCHAAGSVNSGGPLTDYSKISTHSSEIKFQVENNLMPKVGSLTADQKNKIICWVNSGAPNN